MLKRTLLCLLCLMPLASPAAVIFEFDSPCTDFVRNTDCADFGLGSSDRVTGGFRVDDALGAPGAISSLTSDQYEFVFSFGNQSFSEQDATGVFNFLVSGDGAAISSLLGNFRNAGGAVLSLLTPSTANVALSGFEADTFGGGGGWRLAPGSALFTDPGSPAVPLPPSLALVLPALGLLATARRRRDWR